MRVTSTILIVAICLVLIGCATAHPDHHVLKQDKTYNPAISNPYEWALQQFADGSISGPKISDYARLVLKYGLKEAHADLVHDGSQELLLRQDCTARVWEVLVFKPARSGYQYLGHFTASIIVLDPKQKSILVYEAYGGKYGYIKFYKHDGHKFTGTMLQDIWWGDGYEENTKKMTKLFPEDEMIKWAPTPNSIVTGGKIESTGSAGSESLQ